MGKQTGGPAFPCGVAITPGNMMVVTPAALRGMTLLDYFAVHIVQGVMVNARLPGLMDDDPEAREQATAEADAMAVAVYRVASAMVKASRAANDTLENPGRIDD